MEVSRKQKVSRLIEASFGKVSRAPTPILPVTLTSHYSSRGRRDSGEPRRAAHAELIRQIEAAEKAILELPDAELNARYSALVASDRTQAEARALREELQRPFNLPEAVADYEFWVRADLWTLDEAIALLLGKDPRKVNLALVRLYQNISAFARQYLDLRMLAERTALMHHGRAMVRQLDVARWVTDAKLDVPLGLVKAMQARHGKPGQDDELSARQSEGTSQTAAAPASLPAAPAGVLVHSTKAKRRDSLDPAIELAQSQCKDAKDTAEVWGRLQVLALEEHPPFLAVTPDGLKYTKKGDEPEYFTRDALDKRLHPEKRHKRREPPQRAT